MSDVDTPTIWFLLRIGELKRVPCAVWEEAGVEDSETMAQHGFRNAVLTWLLAQEAGPAVDLRRTLELSLVHNLPGLVSDVEGAEAIERLTEELPAERARAVRTAWQEYEAGDTEEATFVRACTTLEKYLRALEIHDGGGNSDDITQHFRAEAEAAAVQAPHNEFLSAVDAHFFQGEDATPLLRFVMELDTLKRLPRRGWVRRGIEQPETVADHTFHVAWMTWLLGRDRVRSRTKATTIALLHEICAVYAGDYTPHDIFSQGLTRFLQRKRWDDRPRRLYKDKQERFLAVYEHESQALRTLVGELPQPVQGQILRLWKDFVECKSAEASFVDQINCLATYMQALEYWQNDDAFPIGVFAEQTVEFIHHPLLVDMLTLVNTHFGLDEAAS